MSGPRRSRRVLWVLTSLFAVVLIAAAGGLVYWQWNENREAELPPGVPARPAPAALQSEFGLLDSAAPAPTAEGVQRAIAAALRDPDLGTFSGQISNPATGEVLWAQDADEPRTPASNAKVLTAAALLLGMPADATVTTTVVAGPGGELILVGAGDPTLSAQPPRDDTFYTDPARITDLADQIRRAGISATSVAVDTDLFPGPYLEESWDPETIETGDMTPISALIVDGGRLEPLEEYSERTPRPALQAGAALATELGVDTRVTETSAPAGAEVVASVESAPLVIRVNDMMRESDNVLAETLAIELSIHRGGPATIAGGTEAILDTLAENGFDTAGTVLRDASGLSAENKVTAVLLDELMNAVVGTEFPALRPLLDGLPVAGGTGTLTDRFDARDNEGRGWVRAKTGTLTGVSSLTGIVQTVDGRVLSFAMMSGGTSPADARPALDAVAGKLRECGCR